VTVQYERCRLLLCLDYSTFPKRRKQLSDGTANVKLASFIGSTAHSSLLISQSRRSVFHLHDRLLPQKLTLESRSPFQSRFVMLQVLRQECFVPTGRCCRDCQVASSIGRFDVKLLGRALCWETLELVASLLHKPTQLDFRTKQPSPTQLEA